MPPVDNRYFKKPDESIDQYNTRVSGFQTINSAALSPEKPFVPAVAEESPVPDVSSLNADVSDLFAPTQQEQDFTSSRSRISDLTQQLSGIAPRRAELEVQEDVAGKKRLVQDLSSQLASLQAEAKTIPLQIQQQFEGQGATRGGIAPHETARLRENAIKTLPIAAQLEAARGNLSMAIDLVDRAVNTEFAPIQAKLDAEMKNLDLILKDPAATRQQQERAAQLLERKAAEKQALDDERQNAKDTNDARIRAFSMFTNDPKFTPAVVAQLRAAKTPLDVAGILQYNGLSEQKKPTLENIKLDNGETVIWDKSTGKIVSRLGGAKASTDGASGGTGTVSRDAESVMNGTLNLQDISVKDNYRAGVAAELVKKQKEALSAGDMAGVMRASAAYDKEPSDTFLQSMEKTLSVVSQLGALQDNIANENTGPIVGAFRNANPWDTQAQTIKAQLNAIVPNLARGVYGEVGVLTDNDIKQYAKTIPTLTSTEDIRNAILYITLDQIRKNVEIKIKNQASGQRDMSGYADVYENLNREVSNILSTLPRSKTTQAGNTPLQSGASGKTASGVTWTIE